MRHGVHSPCRMRDVGRLQARLKPRRSRPVNSARGVVSVVKLSRECADLDGSCLFGEAADFPDRIEERAVLRIGPLVAMVVLPSIIAGVALAAQDRYAVQVPNGLAFSEFRGYDGWQTISQSQRSADGRDFGEPRDHRGVPIRGFRERQAVPRWRQDGRDCLIVKNRRDLPGQPLVPIRSMTSISWRRTASG